MTLHQAILSAHSIILPHVLRTPLEYSPWLSQKWKANVWLKMEQIQITGSFKLRGATHKMMTLSEEEKAQGIIAASTGNHGAAVAYIGQKLGVSCEIYLPETVSPAKVGLMELYGAHLHYVGDDAIQAELTARAEAQQQGKVFVSPYNDLDIVAGQGTMGKEIVEDLPEVDAIFVPVGGGGLVSGVAAYTQAIDRPIEIVGCQPAHSAVMYESIMAGKILDIPSLPTLSDGTAGGMELDSITFPLCQEGVDRWVLVSEEEIQQALYFLLEKHYLMVEGAAGLALAAFEKSAEEYVGKTIVLTLCGRKMGLSTLADLLAQG
ncbi:MAG: threonine/serine dehydratase [Bacteroidota bacterium]